MKVQKNIFLLALVGFFLFSITNAFGGSKQNGQALTYSKSIFAGADWNFKENKGQLKDENHQSLPDIKYYGNQGGVNIYCRPGIVSFVFTKISGSLFSKFKEKKVLLPRTNQKLNDNDSITTSRVDMVLLNANPDAEPAGSEMQAYYENYYGNVSHGITNVHTFKTITYKNIYPNIDFILNAIEHGMEYSFLVHQGGNVGDIQIEWKGLDSIQPLQNGGIKYSNRLGSMVESTPVIYQAESTSFSQVLNTSTSKVENLRNNHISFSVPDYDKTKGLLIDPTLDWGTYFGSGIDDFYQGITSDAFGCVYIGSQTLSTSGIATTGAYHTLFTGFCDNFLAKFSSSGSLLWATYYGSDDPGSNVSLTTDKKNNVYITGYTVSDSGIATSGAYQTNMNFGSAFIAKFTSVGALQWGTYYGQYTEGTGIVTDDNCNVYITGSTFDSTGIATAGAYQTSLNGGNWFGDAFIAKFDSSGSSLLWGTYYGGMSDDKANAIGMDKSNNVYITGFTGSSSGIATSRAYNNHYGGSSYNNDTAWGFGDAFIAKFDSSGSSLVWGTYYGGDSTDIATGITITSGNSIYITGWSFSDNGIATAGAYKTNKDTTGSEAFVAKFTLGGNLTWGTYYGNGSTRAEGVASDAFGNIYITGWANCDSGIATAGSYQTSYAGNVDAFLARITPAGALAWGSYYGGKKYDYSDGITVAGNNIVYITGFTNSSSNIATSGAYQTSLSVYGDDYDAFIAKFNFNIKTDAGLPSVAFPAATICAGTYPVQVQLKNFGNDTLKSVTIHWQVNDTLQTSYSWSGSIETDSLATVNIGSYRFISYIDTIIVWTSGPNGVADSNAANDTVMLALIVYPYPHAHASISQSICNGDSTLIGDTAMAGNFYSWSSNPIGFSSIIAMPSVAPSVTTTYYLKVSSAGNCVDSDSVVINIHPRPTVNAGISKTICEGDSAVIGDTAAKGYIYSWASQPSGFSSTLPTVKVAPSVTTIYYLTVADTTTGCKSTASVKIIINPASTASAGSSNAICFGDTAILGTGAVSGNTYSWTSKPAGFNSTLSTFFVRPAVTTTYYLKVSNVAHCRASDSVVVTINPLPMANAGKPRSLCYGDSIIIGDTGNNRDIYSWTSKPSGFTSILSMTKITLAATTVYYLAVNDTATGCKNVDSVKIIVNPLPDAHFSAVNTQGTTYQFTARKPGLASYSWVFGDVNTGTGDTTTHTYLADSIYKISLKTTDSAGCSSVFDSSLDVLTAINSSLLSQINWQIYPNPFSETTNITYTLPTPAYAHVSITDVFGRKIVILCDEKQDAGSHTLIFDTRENNIPASAYFVRLVINNVLAVKQMIKVDLK